MFHLRPSSSDLGLVASNAFHYFFKLAAYLRLRVAGLFSNRDFQMSKLFVDVDELETNLSTEFIYMRTHGEPLAGIYPPPPALLCRIETETSEARQICENSCKAIGQAAGTRFGFIDATSGLPLGVESSYQCQDAVRRSAAHFGVTPRRGRPGNKIGERSPLDSGVRKIARLDGAPALPIGLARTRA
jgi:hypothetical protein